MNLLDDPGVRTAESAARTLRSGVEAALGCGATVLVEGPLGSGVSRMLDELSAGLRGQGVNVRWARAVGVGGADPVAGLLADLVPGPGVVVIDDVHRVRPEAAAALADQLRNPTPGVAVIIAGRSGQIAQTLRSCAGGHEHSVPAWGLDDIRTAYPSLGQTRAEHLVAAAHGRPAFVRALAGLRLLELRELHRLPIDALAERVDIAGFHGWAAEAFAAADTRLVAGTAAILGDTVDLDAVADVAELPTSGAAHAAVLTLVGEGVLVVRESRIAFAHPVLKAVCYAQVDPARRQVLHRRAAERARDPRWPGAVPIASHLCVAAASGDLAVVHELVVAARECLLTSPSTAERWSRCAVRLCPTPDAGPAVPARMVLGSALAAQGRVLEAAAVAKELMSIPEARRAATVLAARCERALGNEDVAAALIRAEARDCTDDDLPEELLLESAIAGVTTGGMSPTDLQLGAGHRVAIEIVGVVRAEAASLDRDLVADRLDAVHAQVAALPASELSRIVEQLAPLALACLRAGRTELAGGLVAHGLHVAGARGEVLVDLLNAEAMVEARRGRLDASRRSASQAAEIAAELGLTRAGSLSSAVTSQLDALAKGIEPPAQSPAASIGSSAVAREVQALHAEAQAMLGTAPAEPWWVALLGRGPGQGGSSRAADRDAGGLRHPSLAAEAAATAGDVESARALLGERPQGVAPIDLAWWTRAAAVVLTQAGDVEAGHDLAVEAIAAWSGIGWPLEVSRSRLVLAENLRRQGDHRRAEREAGLAKAAALRVGADALVQRGIVLQKRIAAGQSRGLRGGEFGLSAREAEIAQHVCSGRTNREIAALLFLSVRTVDSHVAKVLTKVGVQTRVSLAAMFAAEPAVA